MKEKYKRKGKTPVHGLETPHFGPPRIHYRAAHCLFLASARVLVTPLISGPG
jgi:hypothetical protein